MQCYNCNSGRLKYDKDRDAYICLDCGYEFPKQYFFISHSHLDIEKVRIIRNIIEETFFYEPILFFLKCLSDENEINHLLQREIAERIWFVYCKSKNAEQSKFVQNERKYIDDLMKRGTYKQLLTVELDEFEIWDERCYEYIRQQIAYQIRKTKIFLSYSHRDEATAAFLRKRFTERGYSVWWDGELTLAESWQQTIRNKIKEHSYKDGLILHIVSENSWKSEVVMDEIGYALARGAMIVPIVIDAAKISNQIRANMPNLLYFSFDLENAERSFERLLEGIARL